MNAAQEKALRLAIDASAFAENPAVTLARAETYYAEITRQDASGNAQHLAWLQEQRRPGRLPGSGGLF